jgi:GT2 family glycosyltransferase
MTPPPTVLPASVIVVSRHRPDALRLCLTALSQQDHPRFEVIVVADPDGLSAVQAQGLAVRQVAFDEANVSAARNAGLRQAAGDIVAFIDDDAVAEPTWLTRLCAGFAETGVVAATGFVRGRNGIAYQWQACDVDAAGQDHAIVVPFAGVTLRAGTRRRAVKTQGTNCAFRRATLCAAGGFDPAFRFFLDEADVNLRLAGLTAVVPLAQVHHGYLASARRRGDRVPTDLTEIAARTAVFLRRHSPATLDAGLVALRKREQVRLAGHLSARRIAQTEADRLLATLNAGWAEGLTRPIIAPQALRVDPTAVFQPLPRTGPRPGALISGRFWQRKSVLAQARAAVENGATVTAICLSPTLRAHRMRFHPDGFWLHEGGVFGWSDRTGPRFLLSTVAARITQEAERWTVVRPLDARAPPQWR